MVHKVYSFYDKKARFFDKLIMLKEDGEALRLFSDLKNDPKTMIGVHPDDFELYKIGEFDDNNGTFISLNIPQIVVSSIVEDNIPTVVENVKPKKKFGLF